jgi:hypothetical protein
LEFESQIALPNPKILDRSHEFKPSSGTDHMAFEPRQVAEAAATEGDGRIILDFLIASPIKSFGKTLSFGNGPSHGLAFSILGDDPFEVYEDDTERTPLLLSAL